MIHDRLVHVAKHQFALVDRHGSDIWQNPDWHAISLGVAPGLATVFTERSHGRVPLVVELADAAPALDEAHWSRLVLGDILCPGGVLYLRELGCPAEAPLFELAPVPHRLLVCAGNLDGCDRDGSVGPDHYRVVLWPGPPEPPRVLKAHPPALHRRRTPILPLGRCMELAASTDRGARYLAIAELARHGTDEALARLEACSRRGDVLDRVLAAQALALGDPARIDRLEAFQDDPEPEVRSGVVSVLHQAMLDFEFSEAAASTLDTDVAYRILNRAGADPDPSVREGIAGMTSYLDGLVELVPPADDAETTHARAVLARLQEEGLLEVDADFDPGTTARAIAAAIDDAAYDAPTPAAAIADALVDQPGVVDLHADDDALARILDATRPRT